MMIPMRACDSILALLICGTPIAGLSQTTGVGPDQLKSLPADCNGPSLEVMPRFFQALDGIRVMAADIKNSTSDACTLRSDEGGLQQPVSSMPGSPYILEPGATAHTSFRWTSRPASSGYPPTAPEGCTIGSDRTFGVNHGTRNFLVISPTLLPPICSEIHHDPYSAGPFSPDWPENGGGKVPQIPSVQLTSTKQTYNKGEYVPLRLVISGLDRSTPMSKYGCPLLFRLTRSPSGFFRMEEVSPIETDPLMPNYAVKFVKHCVDSKPPASSDPTKFDLDVEPYDENSATNMQFFTVAGIMPSGEFRLEASNVLRLNIADPREMKRTWGAAREDVRVSLALDKLTYTVGEDIPLHIAAQVLSPKHPVYAEPDVPRQGGQSFHAAFHLTILDQDGIPAGEERRANLWLMPLTGGGPNVCPAPIAPSSVLPLEVSSKLLRLLPSQPGTYTMTVSWRPYREHDPPCSRDAWKEKRGEILPFVTVSSVPITIRIEGEATSKPGIPQLPSYTGWKAGFRIVDTAFGEGTALEDRKSHLQWLRLSVIKGIPDDRLQNRMKDDEEFTGWRFATESELRGFFKNFTENPDGHSSDAAMERALQRLLGGPLSTAENRETGWSRRAMYAYLAGADAVEHGPCVNCEGGFKHRFAYIAEDTLHGEITATIDPDQQDWSVSRRVGGGEGAVLLVRTVPASSLSTISAGEGSTGVKRKTAKR